MPAPLTSLYVLPSDLYDDLSTEGVDLRMDDHGDATGYTIQATADALVGATTINVTALAAPLLSGTQLHFDGSNMSAVVDVTLSAVALLGATSLTVSPLSSQVNNLAKAQDSGVNVATAARLTKACKYGTDQVKLYCCTRYDDSDLATSWSANRWATAAAKKWFCRRRAQPLPKSVAEDWEEALTELKQVRVGMLDISDIPTRVPGGPFITNVTVDVGFDVVKLRVEPQISEGQPTQYPQFVDWNSFLLIEW